MASTTLPCAASGSVPDSDDECPRRSHECISFVYFTSRPTEVASTKVETEIRKYTYSTLTFPSRDGVQAVFYAADGLGNTLPAFLTPVQHTIPACLSTNAAIDTWCYPPMILLRRIASTFHHNMCTRYPSSTGGVATIL